MTKHAISIGQRDFLLDGESLQIRCGELHFARVPREYWGHRLQLLKAMGHNAVCAYLFWNFHEWEQGRFDWEGDADAAEFCRQAQAQGLWVVLRPGPYVCAEWEMGGLPWWLLKKPDMALRSRDADYLAAVRIWLKEVGRVLAPMQVTNGGPILLVQVENEYGFYGNDAEYMNGMRQTILEAGFDVPLFSCNPPSTLKNGLVTDLFQVVNFGADPKAGFEALREVQPSGPLMCGEFYSGWFDTWGFPHHLGKTENYLRDLEFMLMQNASFSVYMSHGGTSFGMWSGTDRPFKPDTSSYDYDAPINEAGWIGEKFQRTRQVMSRYLKPGETLPEPVGPKPVISIAPFPLNRSAAIFENLPEPVFVEMPGPMEIYDQGRGCILYRTTISAGPAARLEVNAAHDFAWVFVDGTPAGVMDRRKRRFSIELPGRVLETRLDILCYAMGRVNFGPEMHDRKGLHGPVTLGETGLKNWEIFRLPLDDKMLSALHWKTAGGIGPAFWSGSFNVDEPADTFLDLRSWGKGVVWVNGRCLARYWNIGPTQTAYLPGPWLKAGENGIIILDLLGPLEPMVAGLVAPVLDQLRPELDFSCHGPQVLLQLSDDAVAHEGEFASGSEAKDVFFAEAREGRQVCIETMDAHDGKEFAAIAELDLYDGDGKSISHTTWTIPYVDSEELVAEDGSCFNAINGQVADMWHTEYSNATPGHPHRLVIDLGANCKIRGLRYWPRADHGAGRIKGFRIYVGNRLVESAG